MARRKTKKPKITDSQLTQLYEDFLEFCPKLHKVDYHCTYDSECLCGKCCIKFMVDKHGDLLGEVEKD